MSTIYESLNVKPVINAIGTFTRLSGSLMPPEVVQAMVEASGTVAFRPVGTHGVPADFGT